MKGMARSALTVLLLVASSCDLSHTRSNSSGSNWLRCERVADCSAAGEAAACENGYCVDEEGVRIEAVLEAGGDGGPSREASCVWGVDALLRHVGASAPGRVDCGGFNSLQQREIRTAMACFENAVSARRTAELTINRCPDCAVPTTYVAAEGGETFAVLLESDTFGDALSHARVERCSSVALVPMSDEFADVVCQDPDELYDCEAAFRPPSTTEESGPVEPFKLSDVPTAAGTASVPLHLYVSNQSFENELVDIDVYIHGARVVTGDFAVEGQHNWYQFDVQVPAGTLALRAVSAEGDADFAETIEVPAERWAVLDYWYHPDDAEGPRFTLTVSDVPVGFD